MKTYRFEVFIRDAENSPISPKTMEETRNGIQETIQIYLKMSPSPLNVVTVSLKEFKYEAE